jgi:hypothetical protein
VLHQDNGDTVPHGQALGLDIRRVCAQPARVRVTRVYRLAHVVEQRGFQKGILPVAGAVQGVEHIQAVTLVATIHTPEQSHLSR